MVTKEFSKSEITIADFEEFVKDFPKDTVIKFWKPDSNGWFTVSVDAGEIEFDDKEKSITFKE